MALDLEQLMILLQRRYNTIREIASLTDELAESMSRHDQVSASVLLQMRADEIEKCDECMLKIWEMAESGAEEAAQIQRLMASGSQKEESALGPEEKRILEIRRKTGELLETVRQKDQMLSGRVGGEKSFYHKKKL